MTIHKEGHSLLITLLIVFFVLNAALFYFIPEAKVIQGISITVSVIFFLLILQFFRNPRRTIPQGENLVIAPADGKVVVIEQTQEDEYFKDERIQISIFMSPVNVHLSRNPISGVIKFFKYHPGKFLVAWHPKSSTDNERTTLVSENSNGVQVLYRQIAGALARRIRWYVNEGDEVKQGEEFGFIKFGSRIDVYLPLNAKINVELDQKTRGGETVIATL
ncbi:phosphatidylserine decarboxylase family protein [Flammeovirga yaeyamensis]|uniref:Phosphatidylserine decarboxylase proenzyme n=1 Tax=Flammeovirga yaeyamensis TaxID=367791 RepID=A0AAX1N137_9BACT|nr:MULTISPECIES: phosphatidylserine decarboxylase family protein [Flammeovirga]ANQ47408.1 phosphatidylserine decarboxylase family protein [Flammeovirga sp. MY04]MBB3698454.1 phosphatidylserine decarboxylase [Flammeovirga yaeyamensis]NMF34197.1 phosphatidylserine decarboxylase family protein [Flammeovirga yaeyamensis]QWG01182.1 phosphatidylserine decarboxylase family protein [Flammeovirga yaeyamensis]